MTTTLVRQHHRRKPAKRSLAPKQNRVMTPKEKQLVAEIEAILRPPPPSLTRWVAGVFRSLAAWIRGER